MQPLLEVEGLKKTYPGFQLNGVGWRVSSRGRCCKGPSDNGRRRGSLAPGPDVHRRTN